MQSCLPKRGISILEVVVILVCIVVVAAILFPVFAQHGDSGEVTQCIDNMKQLSSAFQMEAGNNNEMLPAANDWAVKLGLKSKVFDCHKTTHIGTAIAPDYMYVAAFFHNQHGLLSRRKLGDIKDPTLAPMLVELANPGKSGQTAYVSDAIEVSPGKYAYDLKVALYNKIDRTRHNYGSNVAYVDGHVAALKATEFTEAILLNSMTAHEPVIKP